MCSFARICGKEEEALFYGKLYEEILRREKEDFSDNSEYTDEHMKVTVKYDSNENKVSFKCQKLDKTSDKKEEKKEDKDKK